MAQTLLERIATKAANANVNQRLESARWFRSKLATMRVSPRTLITEQRTNLRSKRTTHIIGKMFSFFYDPKTKESLSWYDRFPLVIPVQETVDGFVGLNLHYLNPKMRMLFMSKLVKFVSDENYDEKTRMRLTWRLVNTGTLRRYALPSVKRYIRGNIKSRLLEFQAEEWVMAVFLPTERFKGASKQKVWKESL